MYHLIYPFIGIICYLLVPTFLRPVSKPIIDCFTIVHNSLLSIFSLVIFCMSVHVLYNDFQIPSHNHYFLSQHFDNIQFYFLLSKYYEFIDTWLLYVKGKTPPILQKYHHIGAILGWHLPYYYKIDAIMIGTICNSFVHTIMYAYYTATVLQIDVRWIKKYITRLQLIQFVVVFITITFLYYDQETAFNYGIILFTHAYNVGLMYLFSVFYNKTYKVV